MLVQLHWVGSYGASKYMASHVSGGTLIWILVLSQVSDLQRLVFTGSIEESVCRPVWRRLRKYGEGER